MAMWLFRRRSRRKRPHSGTLLGDDGPLARSQTTPEYGADLIPSRQMSSKKQRTEPNKLHRRPRTYSFESGREDEIRIGRKRSSRGPKRESAPTPMGTAGVASPPTSLGKFHKGSQVAGAGVERREANTAIPEHYVAFNRIPTLHASKRDGGHLMSRKLSKRQKNSHERAREAELKALRDFTPVRPATDAWTAGRPMKKDSRRVKSGFALVRSPWEREQHPSDVSLPIPESIHSSLSSDSEQISYKVSAFDVLAPKPTLRYAVYPRWGEPPSTESGPMRTTSQRRKFSDRSPIPEATLRAHKRIDDLADDLNASDLRELMERDQRRRDRKRAREQLQVERKLAKAAEQQKREAENGRESPPNLERGVLGREASSPPGRDSTSAVVTSSRHRHHSDSSSRKQRGKRPAADESGDDGRDEDVVMSEGPIHAFHRVSSIPPEPQTPAKRPHKAVPHPPPAQTRDTPSHASAITQTQTTQPEHQMDIPGRDQSPAPSGFMRSMKYRSKSPLSDQMESDTSGPLQKTPKTSDGSSRGPLSWTSIFKWSRLRSKRGSDPSSFSNASRDSMTPQPQPQPAAPPNMTLIPPPAPGRPTIPKRTRSRFREDLPELPLSPPDSRVQSPEQDVIPPVPVESRSAGVPAPTAPVNIHGARYDTPNSDSARPTPHSWTRDGLERSPEPTQSMSLASIDSEGSWLSGRLRSGRVSSQLRNRPDSFSRLQAQTSLESSDATETAGNDGMDADSVTGITDDEYLDRVARHGSNRDSSMWARPRSTGEARPSSDEEDDARWGAVGGRKPMMVHARMEDRMKSREGLLNNVQGDADDDHRSEAGELIELDSPVSAEGDVSGRTTLERATSIKLGKGHARHISAGSAKLLELSPRGSTDAKRKSSDNRWPEVASTLVE